MPSSLSARLNHLHYALLSICPFKPPTLCPPLSLPAYSAYTMPSSLSARLKRLHYALLSLCPFKAPTVCPPLYLPSLPPARPAATPQ